VELEKSNLVIKEVFNEILDKIGMMPLPPYIHEEFKTKKIDIRLFMQNMMDQQQHLQQGCTLHQNYLKRLEDKGVIIANVTLHVGIGTFRPVKEDTVENHEMHSEHYYIKQEDAVKD